MVKRRVSKKLSRKKSSRRTSKRRNSRNKRVSKKHVRRSSKKKNRRVRKHSSKRKNKKQIKRRSSIRKNKKQIGGASRIRDEDIIDVDSALAPASASATLIDCETKYDELTGLLRSMTTITPDIQKVLEHINDSGPSTAPRFPPRRPSGSKVRQKPAISPLAKTYPPTPPGRAVASAQLLKARTTTKDEVADLLLKKPNPSKGPNSRHV